MQAGHSPWVVFLDEDDVPETELLATLIRAQAVSGADAVTSGVYLADDGERATIHLFSGESTGLGVLSNDYGNVALLRRSLLGEVRTAWPIAGDADWPLLAGLSMSGARIVSVPIPLVARKTRPGTIEDHPSDALLAVEQMEQALPDPLASVARLAAGLAADRQVSQATDSAGVLHRGVDIVRKQGLLELARRSLRRGLADRP